MNKTQTFSPLAKLFGVAVLSALAGCNTSGALLGKEPFTVKIISFNDYHGNLEAAGTLGTSTAVLPAYRPPVGGADYLAAHVSALKKQNPLNVVVAAGDLIGATPLISSLFFDEPSVETLNRIGLEFSSVGNHEFDNGSAHLLRLQNGGCKQTAGAPDANSCKGAAVGTPVPFEGAKFKWLSANVVQKATVKTLLPAYGVKTFNGVKMAFIGMTLKATPGIVSPTSVTGLDFNDEVATVNALIPELRAQGIEAIAVLIHEGGVQAGPLFDINACEGNMANTALAAIVKQFDNAVDVVISGHSHQAYVCQLPNAAGRNVLVTSASSQGRLLTDIDLTINPATRDVTAAVATNRLVVRNDPQIVADAAVAKLVKGYSDLIAPIANVVVGSIAANVPNTRLDGACNNPAGNLIADAQLAATQPASLGGAVASFINAGGVRDAGFTFASSPAGEGDGNVTYREVFTVQPFGNTLMVMSLRTADIKDFLEEQFAGCLGQAVDRTRIALPSAGFSYMWDGAKGCGARISSVALRTSTGSETLVDAAGVIQNPAKTYRIAVNIFMADGGDGFTTLKKGADRLGGAQDIDALTAYLSSNFKAPKAPYVPGLNSNPLDAGKPRITRVGASTNCPGGTLTNP